VGSVNAERARQAGRRRRGFAHPKFPGDGSYEESL
jgi:hypothetical protein